MSVAKESTSDTTSSLPTASIQRWLRPFLHFFRIEAASGIVLVCCTVIALTLANSPWAEQFQLFWQLPARIGVGAWELNKPLLLWINDGLMTIFFFVVGLEIKRELVAGELRDPKAAALPAAAALGGMVVPACMYLLFQAGQPGQAGWGIPMATDIAFVVGFLALMGARAPLSLKILLLALAIIDDIGAVLVIAMFYTSEIALTMLASAMAGFGLVYLFRRIGVRSVPIYTLLGAGIWLAVLKSGVHPTVAGVLLGLLTPATAWVNDRAFIAVLNSTLQQCNEGSDRSIESARHEAIGQLSLAAREAVSPLERLEHALHPWVAFFVMPVFALANAGVEVNTAELGRPVAVAVATGLVLGKPLGILLFSWLAVRFGLAKLPDSLNWKIVLGGGCLAGIGFTMSLFIAGLAFDGELLEAAKVGTITGSVLSAALGLALLLAFLPEQTPSRSAYVARENNGLGS